MVVANSGDNTASIYSAETDAHGPTLTLLKTLPMGKYPREICVAPDGKRAYVANRDQKETTVTAIDLETLTVAATISDPALKSPDGCLVSPDSSKLYVAGAWSNAFFVFSTNDGHKISEFKTGHEPRRILFSKDGSRFYVTHGEERYIGIYDAKTEKQIGTMKAGRNHREIAYTPDGKYLAVTNVNDDAIQFTNAETHEVELVVGVPPYPERLMFYPEKSMLLTLGRYDGVLSMLDLTPGKMYGRFKSKIQIGRQPYCMDIHPDRRTLYITDLGEHNIKIVDLPSMKLAGYTIPTGKAPEGIAVIPRR